MCVPLYAVQLHATTYRYPTSLLVHSSDQGRLSYTAVQCMITGPDFAGATMAYGYVGMTEPQANTYTIYYGTRGETESTLTFHCSCTYYV